MGCQAPSIEPTDRQEDAPTPEGCDCSFSGRRVGGGHWHRKCLCYPRKLPLGCLWNVPIFCHFVRNSFNPGTIKLKFRDQSGSTDVYLLKWLLWAEPWAKASAEDGALVIWRVKGSNLFLHDLRGNRFAKQICVVCKIARGDWKVLKMTGYFPRSLPVLPTASVCGQETRPCSRNSSKQKAGIACWYYYTPCLLWYDLTVSLSLQW